MRKLFTLLALAFYASTFAQIIPISSIQSAAKSNGFRTGKITTQGIVTAKFIGEGMLGGFYLQDEHDDGNPATLDAIFVKTTIDNVNVGDKIEITGAVDVDNINLSLVQPDDIQILERNKAAEPIKIKYGLENPNLMQYKGKLVEFDQILWVNNNYNLERYGELELGVKRKPIPTNLAFPLSNEYEALVNENALASIFLDDGNSTQWVTPIVFADENGTRRMGERVLNLTGILDYVNGKYVVYPAQLPVAFFGNPRKTKHDDIGNYNLKVCGFNLEYYLTSPNSTSMGPSTQEQMNRQHTKIVDALLAIDADIYGLVEVELGQAALSKLSQALNAATGSSRYTYINDGTSIDGTYTKAAYLYRTDKVAPYKTMRSSNVGVQNRKKLQGFTLTSNNERFMFSINHFKAKGCANATGDNTDQGDGQSCYNATRTAEANAMISLISNNQSYYDDTDALVMGDLNAYAFEDPISAFVNAGYTDLHRYFHADSAYSYVFRGEAGYIDHALANESMKKQITGVTTFHINTDELSNFGYSGSSYQPNMFRSSDHDPVIVGIALGNSGDDIIMDEKVKIYQNISDFALHIDEAENFYLQLYTIGGVRLYKYKINSATYSINLKDELGLLPGAYIVRALGEGRIINKLVVVK